MRRGGACAAVVGLAILVWWFLPGPSARRQAETRESVDPPLLDGGPEEIQGEPEPLPPGLKEDLSNNYMKGYGESGMSPEKDLILVKDMLDAFIYSVKVPDALPTSGNREIVDALAGGNAYKIRFLDPAAAFVGPEGQLLDRWGTPLYFHFVEAGDPGVRSAGPDGKMWTGDDVTAGEFAGEEGMD